MPEYQLSPEFMQELRYGTSDPIGRAPDQVPSKDLPAAKTPLDEMLEADATDIEDKTAND